MGIKNVPAEAYDNFMGRYSALLSPLFADFAGLGAAGTADSGVRVLDVGCGTGALTAELGARLGLQAVSAVDPSTSFVEAVRRRYPRVDVREAGVENLPFADASFDVTLAQLVLPVVPAPVAALDQMRRVTRVGGTVAANVWDFGSARSPFSLFWNAARELDPQIRDDSVQHGSREGSLRELFTAAHLREVVEVPLEVEIRYSGFDEWVAPYVGGVGPAGHYYANLEPDQREKLRERCRAGLPSGSFTIAYRAWAARGVAGTP